MTNYRPISLLSVFSKIYEKIVKIRLIAFLNNYNILSNNQYGFRQNCSTIHAIYDLVYNIETYKDANNYVAVIFLDLKKAFDSVNHNTLINKLYSLGIRGLVLDWFTSYLRSRPIHTKINSTISSGQTLKTGVPQGSILSHILFL